MKAVHGSYMETFREYWSNEGALRHAKHLRSHLVSGDAAYVEYQPGDGTRYGLVLTPVESMVRADFTKDKFLVDSNPKYKMSGVGLGSGFPYVWVSFERDGHGWAIDLLQRGDVDQNPVGPWLLHEMGVSHPVTQVALACLLHAIAGGDPRKLLDQLEASWDES